MSTPTDALADLLEASGDLPEGVSIYRAPTSTVKAPAIVIRPDEPWLEPDSFCVDLQRYVAVMVVVASDPPDGQRNLYAMARFLRETLPDAWSWQSVGAIVVDETTDTSLLATAVRIQYRNSGEDEESS